MFVAIILIAIAALAIITSLIAWIKTGDGWAFGIITFLGLPIIVGCILTLCNINIFDGSGGTTLENMWLLVPVNCLACLLLEFVFILVGSAFVATIGALFGAA